MPPRANNQFTMMVAQAWEKLREIKELQFFGGDSLGLKQYRATLTLLPNQQSCWRLIMIPADGATTIPIEMGVRPVNSAGDYVNWKIERVPRTDGRYEALAMFDLSFDDTQRSSELYVTYSGQATFTLEPVSSGAGNVIIG